MANTQYCWKEKTDSKPSHGKTLNLPANKEMPVKTNVCQRSK